jgi:RNA polymerase sigma-70 factor (ECF subfamily)
MTNPKREALLVLLAQSGDRDALESVLREVQTDLLRYITGVVGSSGAEDVLQDVFLIVWRKLKWLRDPELFHPWVWRIASRASFKFLKKERRWSSSTWNPDGETVLVDELPTRPAPSPEFFSGLPAILEQISPASRAVLLLHYVQDLSIEETAAILDINIGTAKSRLAYGLTCLRKSMER